MIKSHLDRNLEVSQLHLNESHRYFSTQLKQEHYLNYKKLESNIYKRVDDKLYLTKLEQLRVTVDCLLDSSQVSVQKYEMLKTFID